MNALRHICLVVVLFVAVAAAGWPGASSGATHDLRLVMLEQALCEWCEAWDEEVGSVYPKTWEGRLAPLRRVDIHDARPPDLADLSWSKFTPTFVLMRDGAEIGRIVCYPGEDFFWGLLTEMLSEAGYLEADPASNRSNS